MHYIYILRSLKTSKFYIGETPNIEARLAFHNDFEKNTNSTKSGIPWQIFWSIEVVDITIARKIESHIKRMKSKKYLQDLKKHPEISVKLIEKYRVKDS